MPDISVIVPTLNEEKYLRNTLQSITAQKTKLDFELLVCDGGSNDSTLKIAEQYADKVLNINKKGIWRGRNEGAKKSKGKLLVFVDADTRLPANYLEVAHAVMEDNSIVALSCAFRFDERNKMLSTVEDVCNNYLLIKGFYGKGEILGFNNAVKRASFFKVGGFPNAPLEDNALGRRLRRIGNIVFLPTPQVITSARRLKSAGILNSGLYYANLELLSLPAGSIKSILKNKALQKTLKDLSVFKDYKPIR